MKNQLRIFFVVFLLFSQIGNAQRVEPVDNSDLVQKIMMPIVAAVIGQSLLNRLPANSTWKMPLQGALVFIVSRLLPLSVQSIQMESRE